MGWAWRHHCWLGFGDYMTHADQVARANARSWRTQARIYRTNSYLNERAAKWEAIWKLRKKRIRAQMRLHRLGCTPSTPCRNSEKRWDWEP
jgi:hypothetical protein